MHLDPSDDETAALTQELHDTELELALEIGAPGRLARHRSPGGPFTLTKLARTPKLPEFADSPVEEAGFEPPVPLAKRVGLSGATGGAAEAKRAVPRASFILRGDRGFESSSLQRRVTNEPFRRWASPDT